MTLFLDQDPDLEKHVTMQLGEQNAFAQDGKKGKLKLYTKTQNKNKNDEGSIGSKTKSTAGSVIEPRYNKKLILHKELHKKTYFNALNKLMMQPKGYVDMPRDFGQDQIFEYVMKKPPKEYEDEEDDDPRKASPKKTSPGNTELFKNAWYDHLIS